MAEMVDSASKQQDNMQGSCLCGNITVSVTLPDLFARPNGHICHCLNCRRSSGAVALNILCLPTANLTFADPESYLKMYFDTNTGSGNTVERSFCSNCGSLIGSLPVRGVEKLSMVALGLFEKIPEPEFEVFVKDRQSWVKAAAREDAQCQMADEFPRFVGKYLQ